MCVPIGTFWRGTRPTVAILEEKPVSVLPFGIHLNIKGVSLEPLWASDISTDMTFWISMAVLLLSLQLWSEGSCVDGHHCPSAEGESCVGQRGQGTAHPRSISSFTTHLPDVIKSQGLQRPPFLLYGV